MDIRTTLTDFARTTLATPLAANRTPDLILRGLGLVAGLILLLLIVTLRGRDDGLYPGVGADSVPVYVAYNGVHANLILPAARIREGGGAAAEAMAQLPARDWVAFGFGDARQYRERGKSPARDHDFIRSMLHPRNPGVMLIDPVEGLPRPEATGRRVLRLELSRAGFEQLRRRLDASFATRNGHVLPAGRGGDPDSGFFRSTDRMDATFVCNHWVALLLSRAGVPVMPVMDIQTSGLAFDLKSRARAIPVPGDPDAFRPLVTPPAYSGRFMAIGGDREIGGVAFDGYGLALFGGPGMATAAMDLVPATTDGWAGRLGVPADSLIERRRILGGGDPRLCDGVASTGLIVGFVEVGASFRIALAGVRADGSACRTLTFDQP